MVPSPPAGSQLWADGTMCQGGGRNRGRGVGVGGRSHGSRGRVEPRVRWNRGSRSGEVRVGGATGPGGWRNCGSGRGGEGGRSRRSGRRMRLAHLASCWALTRRVHGISLAQAPPCWAEREGRFTLGFHPLSPQTRPRDPRYCPVSVQLPATMGLHPRVLDSILPGNLEQRPQTSQCPALTPGPTIRQMLPPSERRRSPSRFLPAKPRPARSMVQ